MLKAGCGRFDRPLGPRSFRLHATRKIPPRQQVAIEPWQLSRYTCHIHYLGGFYRRLSFQAVTRFPGRLLSAWPSVLDHHAGLQPYLVPACSLPCLTLDSSIPLIFDLCINNPLKCPPPLQFAGSCPSLSKPLSGALQNEVLRKAQSLSHYGKSRIAQSRPQSLQRIR
jgi:hypothetical protein